jgi:NHLM bacteriocin system ABC transporter peptidase/ATP-binding protein
MRLTAGWSAKNTEMSDFEQSKRKTGLSKVSTVLQMEAVECGSACLAMILAYHGRVVPPEALRIDCGVSRDGSKASNVLKAARDYGLVAKGFKKEPHELKSIRGPMIVHWNFNHFVVLEGFKRGRVYLNDPAFGRVRISEEEFDQSFTGVVLTFSRGESFKKGGKRKSILASIRPKLQGAMPGVLFVFLAGLALVVPGFVVPMFSRILIDNILIKKMTGWLTPFLIAMGTATVLRGSLVWIQERILLKLETKIALSGSSGFLWHVLHLPVQFFTQRYAGEISNRVGLNDSVASLVGGKLASAALSLLLIVFYGVLLFSYDVILTLAGISIAILNLVFLRLTAAYIKDSNRRRLQDRGKLMGVAMGGLHLIETLKAGGKESEFFSKWAGYQAKLMDSEQQLGNISNYLSAIPAILSALNTAVILVVGGYRVVDGHLTLGTLVAFQALMGNFLAPVVQLVNLGVVLQQTKGELDRLEDVLQYPPDQLILQSERSAGPIEQPRLDGALEIRDLSYGYSPMDGPFIESFNLSLSPGSRVALVGPSGSGKSTIAKLIAGLFEPWSGEMLFDGKPRTEIPREVMTASLAVVDQDIVLFDGSIKENLSLWDTTIPETDIILAAKHAEIHEDISARSGGYENLLEENGRNFSGGQRQRLEIARALTGNPSILILDEATSALDPTTEKLVDENVRKRGCTCIIVAHRLSTIRDCDEIIVLDKGKIRERGTHEELLNSGRLYSDLIKTQ